MATAQRVSDVLSSLSAIRPLGEATNNGGAAPAFSFKPAVAAAAASSMPAKKRGDGDSDGRFEDDDWDPTGPQEKASAEELSKRKIVRRARRGKKGAGAGGAEVAPAKGLFSMPADAPKAAAAAAAAPSFSFGMPKEEQPKAAPAAAAPAFAFSFTASEPKPAAEEKLAAAEKPSFKFGATAAAPPAFAFKMPGAAAPAAAAAVPEPVATAPKPAFSFGFSAAPAASNPAEKEPVDAEADEYEEPQEETNIIAGAGEESETTEREHLARLYRLRDGEWVEQGKGQLKLNRDNASGKRRLLMRAGLRVVLNTPLFEGQMVKVQGAGILITAIEVAEGTQSTANFMVKVNKEQLHSLAESIAAGNGASAASPAAAPAPVEEVPAPVQEVAALVEAPKQDVAAAPAFSFGAPKPAAAAVPKTSKNPIAFVGFKAPDAMAVMPSTSNQAVFTFGGATKLVQPTEDEMDEEDVSDGESDVEEQDEEESEEESEEPGAVEEAPKTSKNPIAFVGFKAPDAMAVMPSTSNQAVFTFGGPTKLVQTNDDEMDEEDVVDVDEQEAVSDESEDEDEDERRDESEGEDSDSSSDVESEEEEEAVQEEYDENYGEEEDGEEVGLGLGAGLAQHVAAKEAASAAAASAAATVDQSGYRVQLEDYQSALEDWVQIAQSEEKHRRALEEQLALGGGAPATPRKQQRDDTAAAEVAELQAQLAKVKAEAEQKLGGLRTELEAQQAAAEALRQQNTETQGALEDWVQIAQREEKQAAALREQNLAAQEEITQLKTPTKAGLAIIPVAMETAQAADDSPAVAALSQEVEILKKLFLAQTAASPAAAEIQQAQAQAPIPSPCRVLATPTSMRGSPHAVGGQVRQASNGQHMNALNKQIASWVNSSLSDNPEADLTPQLKDYLNHMSGWQETHTKWFVNNGN